MRPATIPILASMIVALSSLGVVVTSAWSQEAIPTSTHAPDGGAPIVSDTETDPLRLSDHIDRGPDFMRPRGPCGGPAKTEDGKTDHTPHGEVYAGAGTRGYREAGGVVCVPVGDNAAVTIAVDAGQINGRGYRH